MTGKITRNSAICKKCGDAIESKDRWDFVRCSCGAIAVDGGYEYLRRVGDIDAFNDTSIYEEG